jgi:hypothetical protein
MTVDMADFLKTAFLPCRVTPSKKLESEIDRLRAIKTSRELECIKKAQKIAEDAFSLLPEPFEKLYIPATLKAFEPRQWDRFFYEAEVSPDNHTYKAIDGSIFTADEKTLVYVKISKDGYKVPDGTEIIAKGSLSDVSGTVCIPASVTKIEYEYGLGREITAIRTPKGSYAEQYAKEHRIRAELTVGGEVVEEWEPPKPQFSFTPTDDTPW